MQFERSTGKVRQISLTSLIDVVFLLLFFFMLTTSFIRSESMELSFPSAGEVKARQDGGALQIFIHDDERVFLGMEEMPLNDLKAQLRLLLFKEPDKSILLLNAEQVTVQRLVNIMDDIYLMGGKNVAVARWNPAEGGPKVAGPEEREVAAGVVAGEGAATP